VRKRPARSDLISFKISSILTVTDRWKKVYAVSNYIIDDAARVALAGEFMEVKPSSFDHWRT